MGWLTLEGPCTGLPRAWSSSKGDADAAATPTAKGTRPPPDFFRASSAQDRDRAFQAKRWREDKPSRAKGIASVPVCAFCWNGLRIPATWWWARMRIGAGFRIRSGRAAGNSLRPCLDPKSQNLNFFCKSPAWCSRYSRKIKGLLRFYPCFEPQLRFYPHFF